MSDIPVGSTDRILRKCGARRVSLDASIALRDILEEFSENIAKKAIELSFHRNKKTLSPNDIKLAYKIILEKD